MSSKGITSNPQPVGRIHHLHRPPGTRGQCAFLSFPEISWRNVRCLIQSLLPLRMSSSAATTGLLARQRRTVVARDISRVPNPAETPLYHSISASTTPCAPHAIVIRSSDFDGRAGIQARSSKPERDLPPASRPGNHAYPHRSRGSRCDDPEATPSCLTTARQSSIDRNSTTRQAMGARGACVTILISAKSAVPKSATRRRVVR